MRKLLLLFLVLALWATGPVGAPCTRAMADTKTMKFAWQQPGDLSSLAGWKVYSATIPGGPYTLFSTIAYTGTAMQEYTGTATLTQAQGIKRTYYFILTAYGTNGLESGRSNEVSAVIDFTVPSIPVSFTVTVLPAP